METKSKRASSLCCRLTLQSSIARPGVPMHPSVWEPVVGFGSICIGNAVDQQPAHARFRIPVAELVIIGYGARQRIRKNALQHLHQEITITRRDGSFTFEECLAQLVRRGLLNIEDARARSVHREELDGLLSSARER